MAIINWTNITDFSQFPALANTATDGFFWKGMVWMIFIVLIFLFLNFGFETAIIVPATICLLLSILMLYAGLVTVITPMFFLAIILFFIIYITYSASKK
jgi:hypothetical protein